MSNLASLTLDLDQLREVRDTLARRIDEGLGRDGTEIKALPAYVSALTHAPAGRVATLDLGGTNIRAAACSFGPAGVQVLSSGHADKTLLTDAKVSRTAVSARRLFDRQAELICDAQPEGELSVGYTFSYPAKITPGGGAVLVYWAKGVFIADVEGQDVAQLLREALERKGRVVRRIVVVNDTVASLLAAAVLAPDCSHHVGLIAGTGHNLAAFYPVARIGKLQSPGDASRMAVNLESGNFHPPHLSALDDAFDASLPQHEQGRQRIEKAVAGSYLPKLLWMLLGDAESRRLGLDPTDGDAGARLIDQLVLQKFEPACRLVDRSADLVAAATAGVIASQGAGVRNVGVLGEGTFFKKTVGYAARFTKTLRSLLPSETEIRLIPQPENPGANDIGAGGAVLSDSVES